MSTDNTRHQRPACRSRTGEPSKRKFNARMTTSSNWFQRPVMWRPLESPASQMWFCKTQISIDQLPSQVKILEWMLQGVGVRRAKMERVGAKRHIDACDYTSLCLAIVSWIRSILREELKRRELRRSDGQVEFGSSKDRTYGIGCDMPARISLTFDSKVRPMLCSRKEYTCRVTQSLPHLCIPEYTTTMWK